MNIEFLRPEVVRQLYRNALANLPYEPTLVAFDGYSDRGSVRYLVAFKEHADEILYVREEAGTLRGEVNEDNFSIRIVRPRPHQEPQGGFINFVKKLFGGS